jgi:hypothetical protein
VGFAAGGGLPEQAAANAHDAIASMNRLLELATSPRQCARVFAGASSERRQNLRNFGTRDER